MILMSGNAKNSTGNYIHVLFNGKQLNNTQHGAFYKIMGKITDGNNAIFFSYITEIKNTYFETIGEIERNPHVIIEENPDLIKSEVVAKKSQPITLLTRQYDRTYIQYVYDVTAKVYYSQDNPARDFAYHGGRYLQLMCMSRL